jgi:hypothetical protein
MPPRIIPKSVSCKGCESLKGDYQGINGQGSDVYPIVLYSCKHPKAPRCDRSISWLLTTPEWCPYLQKKKAR